MDDIVLPWGEKFWPLYITVCNSPVDIWGRLYGEEYSKLYNNLMKEIDAFMKLEKKRMDTVERNKFYLVYMGKCWHRVRVDDLDGLEAKAYCTFLDYGGKYWVDLRKLYLCKTRFLRLPAQALPFSLYGLDLLIYNSDALRYLRGMMDKLVFGEIITQEADYYNQGTSLLSQIRIILHNASDGKVVLVNELMLSKFCSDIPPPTIKSKSFTKVQVLHINNDGDLFLKMVNMASNFLETIIEQLVTFKFKRGIPKIVRTDLKRSQLYLIYDDANSKESHWYRGELIEMPNNVNDEEFDFYYVDFGITRRIHISQIFNLKLFSMFLSKYPRQVMKVRMHNIPSVTEKVLVRMRGALSENRKVFVELNEYNVAPCVTVYLRHESTGLMTNLNEDLRLADELEFHPTTLKTDEDKADQILSYRFNNHKSIKFDGSIISMATPQKYLPKLKEYDAAQLDPCVPWEVRVSNSANPSSFTIQPFREYMRLLTILKDLEKYCDNKDEYISIEMVKIGQAYAAKSSEGLYSRVIVVDIIDGDLIHVCFCDDGDMAALKSEQLKTLPAKYRKLPKIGLQAKLYKIKPKHDEWTWNDCQRFRELTVDKKLFANIRCITCDANRPENQILEVDLLDKADDEYIYIDEVLVKENRVLQEATLP